MNSTPSPEKIKKSLSLSWKEGIAGNMMIGIMEYFIIPYGLFLGASTQQIGYIVAIPHLISSMSQLFSVPIIQSTGGSRLRFLVSATSLQATLLLPLAFLAFISFEKRIGFLIFFLILFRILASLIATAWGSLVSDYLPAEKRGHYLGWRAQIVGIAALVGMGLGGILLFSLKKTSESAGFFVLFLTASLCRFFSSRLMSKMTDLPTHKTPADDFTFFMFIRRFKESNFVKFVLFISSMMFAAYVSAPYFSVYMLRDLHFSYLNYVTVHVSSMIAGLIAFPIWGKHADMVGNAKLLKILGLLVPLMPLLILASSSPVYFIIIEFVSGFVWSGFNLCATNFIYDAVSPAKRIRCLGYFNLINGVAIFLGTALGGFLADRLPSLWGFSLLTLFVVSSLLRFTSHFFLSGKFKEVRETVHKVSSIQVLMSALGIRLLGGLTRRWNVKFPTDEL